jgi:hypothetical protein
MVAWIGRGGAPGPSISALQPADVRHARRYEHWIFPRDPRFAE